MSPPKTALIIIGDGVEEMEAVITADVLRRGGVEVQFFSLFLIPFLDISPIGDICWTEWGWDSHMC